MPATVPLVSAEELRKFLGYRDNDTSADADNMALALVATHQIEKAVSRELEYGSFTELFDASDNVSDGFAMRGAEVYADTRNVSPVRFKLCGLKIDVSAAMSVRYDPGRKFDDDTEVASNLYRFDADTCIVKAYFAMRRAPDAVQISYSAGFKVADGSMSADAFPLFKEACLLQTGFLKTRRRLDNIGVEGDRSMGKSDEAVSSAKWLADGGLTPEAAKLVASSRGILTGRR